MKVIDRAEIGVVIYGLDRSSWKLNCYPAFVIHWNLEELSTLLCKRRQSLLAKDIFGS